MNRKALLATLIVLATSSMSQAQQAESPKEPVAVRSFNSRDADAVGMASILQDQFPGVAFSADPVSKTIFARIDGNDAKAVEKLILEVSERAREAQQVLQKKREAEQQRAVEDMRIAEKLAQEAISKPQLVLKRFDVRYIRASEAVPVLLQLGFEVSNISIMSLGNSILVRGPQDKLDEIAQVLELIDSAEDVEEQEVVVDGVRWDPGAAVVEGVRLDPANAVVQGRREEEWNVRREAEQLERARQNLKAESVQLSDLTQHLADAIQQSEEPERKKVVTELQNVIARQFGARLEMQRVQLKRLELELHQVRKNLAMQERLRAQIIEKRLAELMEASQGERKIQQQKERLQEAANSQRLAIEKAVQAQRASQAASQSQRELQKELAMVLEALSEEAARNGGQLKKREAELRKRVQQQYEELIQLQPDGQTSGKSSGSEADEPEEDGEEEEEQEVRVENGEASVIVEGHLFVEPKGVRF